MSPRKPVAEPAAGDAPSPSRHGGAYQDGKRDGPAPDYGFVVNAAGQRVPAGPDGQPADGRTPRDAAEE